MVFPTDAEKRYNFKVHFQIRNTKQNGNFRKQI